MLLTDLKHLKPADELAVIINLNTRLIATLALLSTLRHAAMPVLLIDCQSADGSFEHFTHLMETCSFDLLSAPRKKHGQTLDWLFQNVPAKKVLLVDSDLEILDPEIIKFLREFIEHAQTFGSGFINGPQRLTDHAGTILENAYFQERIWMPLTLLKTSFMREAINAGHSFAASTVYNDLASFPRVSRAFAKLRHRHPWLRKLGLQTPRAFRREFHGQHPSIIYQDTGADIYQHLRYERELWFAGLPEPYHPRHVTHFFGTTRNALGEKGPHSGDRHNANLALASSRLKEIYGFAPLK
jgi:hypothetical protein